MPFVPVTLKVTNSSDNTPIAGARVFIDGAVNFDPNQFVVVTDAGGNASFQVPSNLSNRQLQITADNFQSNSQVISTTSLNPQSIQVKLDPVQAQSAIVKFEFVPEVAGILWVLNPSAVANGVSNDGGTSQTDNPIPFGNYTVDADLAGYQHLSVPIVVNGQIDPYVLGLVANANSDTVQKGNTSDSLASTNQSASKLSQVTTEPPALSEYIYPNTDYDKYFTITGARIYIGNLFIDECNTVQYGVQDNAVPVFGYASRFYDALGQGRSMVQGQLTLNFVTEGYLYTVLQEYKRYLASTQGNGFPINSPRVDSVAQVLGLMATRDNLLQQSKNNPNTAEVAAITGVDPEIRAGQIQSQISAAMNSMTPDQVESLSNQRTRQLKGFSDVIAFDNAVYQDVLFDIRVELGNESSGVKRVRYLEKCKLISNEQVIASDGQTILDSYGFIARRLR
jgi:hypothetical protein